MSLLFFGNAFITARIINLEQFVTVFLSTFYLVKQNINDKECLDKL